MKYLPCLWTLYSFSNATHNQLLFTNVTYTNINSSVLLTIKNLNISCFTSFLKIYDGIPVNPRPYTTDTTILLDTLCGVVTKPLYYRSTAGILTLSYYGPSSNSPNGFHGFLAEYDLLKCPDKCPPPFKCKHNQCLCPSGSSGIRCEINQNYLVS